MKTNYLFILIAWLMLGITPGSRGSGNQPPCSIIQNTYAKTVSFDEYQSVYEAVRKFGFDGAPSLAEFSTIASGPEDVTSTSLFGFNITCSTKVQYGRPKELDHYNTGTNFPKGPLEYYYQFSGLALTKTKVKGANIKFQIDPARFPNNGKGLKIEFGNGDTINFPTVATSHTTFYQWRGTKTITVYWEEDNDEYCMGQKVEKNHMMQFELEVEDYALPGAFQNHHVSVDPEIASVDKAEASYEIFKSSDDVFDQPLIVVPGYDFMHTTDEHTILRDLMYYDNPLYNDLINSGHDIVLVKYGKQNDFIQNTAAALRGIILDMQTRYPGLAQNKIIGVSLGGVVARITLKEMEDSNEDHRTSLYISYDSPHNGAHVPLGLQKMVHDAATNGEITDLNNLADLFETLSLGVFENNTNKYLRSVGALNSEIHSFAASQLLSYHITNQAAHVEFQEYLTDLGFPEQTRNVAIVCGALDGSRQTMEFEAGDKIFHREVGVNDLFGKVLFRAWSPRFNDRNRVLSSTKVTSGFDSNTYEGRYDYDNLDMDHTPGGYIDILEGLPGNGFIGSSNRFNFVAIASALGVDSAKLRASTAFNYTDYFNESSTDSDTTTRNMDFDFGPLHTQGVHPFDEIYAPQSINVKHVQLTSATNRRNLRRVLEQEVMNEPPVITFSETTSQFGTPVSVRIEATDDHDSNVAVYYTLDGSTPDRSSSFFVNGRTIDVTATQTITVRAWDSNNNASETIAHTYTINVAPVLSFSVLGGTFTSAQSVELTASHDFGPQNRIYYTTDGSQPTVNSSFFSPSGTINVDRNMTIRAFARDHFGLRSPEQSEEYRLQNAMVFPYAQSFDSEYGNSGVDCGETVNLQTPFWSNVTGDDDDWRVRNTSTKSSNTGPSRDHSGNGYYLYCEASFQCNGKTVHLESNPFNLDQQKEVQVAFWYHMYGEHMGDLELQYAANNSNSWQRLARISGNKGNEWFERIVTLPPAAKTSGTKFRFVGTTGHDFRSDIAIDDFSIQLIEPEQCIASLPYSQSFNSETNSNTDCGTDVQLNTNGWRNVDYSDNDWKALNIKTPSNNTGPVKDHSGDGFYLYAEATRECKNKLHYLEGPCFDLSNQTNIEVVFWYHMYGQDMGTLALQYSTDNSSTWGGVTTIVGEQGNAWKERKATLANAVLTSNTKFRFVAQTGNDYRSDIAIDDFSIRVKAEDRGTAPVVSLSNSSGDCPLTTKVSATDVDGDVERIYYTRNGSEPIPTTAYTFVVGNGQNITINDGDNVKVKAYDVKGNTSIVKTAKCTVNNGSSPVVSLSATGGDCPLSVLISATDVDGDLDRIYYTKNGSEPIPTTAYTFIVTNGQNIVVAKGETLRVKAYDRKGNRSAVKSASCTEPGNGLTVFFKPPNGNTTQPRMHHWNTAPNRPSSSWPGVLMSDATNEQEAGWFKHTIDGATSTSLLFHLNNGSNGGYKIGTQNNVTGGCFDGDANDWVRCPSDGPIGSFTVYFKRPANTLGTPRIHHWNTEPGNSSSSWPGSLMTPAGEKGTDWFKYVFTGKTSTCLLFHDGNRYKTANQCNVTGGCYNGDTKKWECPTVGDVAPEVTLTKTSGDCPLTTTVTATDADGDLERIYYTRNGSEPIPTTAYTFVVGNGQSITINDGDNVKVKAYDAKGNTSVVKTAKCTVNRGSAPVVGLSTTGGDCPLSVRVNATDVDGDLDRIYYTRNGSEPIPTTPYTYVVNNGQNIVVNDGDNVKVKAYDAMGNTSVVRTVKCTVDNGTAPVVSLSATGGDCPLNVKVNATDVDGDLHNIYYTRNGSEPIPTTAYTFAASNGQTIIVADGEVLKVKAYDVKGNRSVVKTAKCTVPSPGLTVYFKVPAGHDKTPKIHHWNTAPNRPSSSWPGKDMTDASGEKGAGWFKITIPNATSTSCLFHFNNGGNGGYKTSTQNNVTGGCFNYDLNYWTCDEPTVGMTVYFKRPSNSNSTPRVHHWNTEPNQASSSWPGTLMTDASTEKGADWFKMEWPTATSTSLLFHVNNGGTGGYKTGTKNNVRGGCYDMGINDWTTCPPSINAANLVAPEEAYEWSEFDNVPLVTSNFDEVSEEAQFRIYPNPASDYLNIVKEGGSDDDWSIRVTDILGKVQFVSVNNGSNAVLDLSDWVTGSYFVTITSHGSEMHQRLIVK